MCTTELLASLDRYREAAHRGTQWLLSRQNADGSFIRDDLQADVYHKGAYALAVTGHTLEAHRLLNWIRREALGAYDYANTVNLIVLRVDGTLQHAGGEGVDARPFAEAFDLPPAPTKPAELKQWLEKVYGPGGIVKLGPDEDWYGSIKSVKPGESVSAAAIVETSLPTATDPRFSMVQLAVSSSSTPMLQQGIWISALDGTGASMGGGGGSPLLYPAP